MSRLDFLFGFADAFFESAHREVGLFFVNDEWRRETKGIFARSEDEQALVESLVHDDVTQLRRAFFGPLVAHNFDTDHQAAATHVADNLELLRPIAGFRENIVADFLGIRSQPALEQIERGNGRREADGVPAEGGAVRTGLDRKSVV